MSHYVECQTEFRDVQALVAALKACGFEAHQIELHPEAVPLYGYKGDVRPQQAHLVIHREHVGTAANDVGWEKQPNGTYRAWISEYDARHRFNLQLQNKIRQEYAYHAVARQQQALGRTVQRRMLTTGEIEVTIGGYR
jgi:hypothetical protein